MDATRFVGTWSLQSFHATTPDGSVVYPFGEAAVGRITYDPFGRMSVQLMEGERPALSVADPRGAPDHEVVSAFGSYIGYLGRYIVDEKAGEIVHHLEVASIPNWVGSDQLRRFEFDGDSLTLSTPPIVIDGVPVESVLVWQKD